MKKIIIYVLLISWILWISSCYNNIKQNDTHNEIINNWSEEEKWKDNIVNKISEKAEMKKYVNSMMTKKDFYKTVDCDKYVNIKVIEQCKKDKEKVPNLIKSNSWEIESINNKVNTDFYNENTQNFIKELQEKPEILLNDCSELGDSETISYCLDLQKDYNDSLNKNN